MRGMNDFDAFSITFGHILIFLAFMGVAWIVNRIARRPLMNGALFYLVAALLLVINLVVQLFAADSSVPPNARSYVLGQIVGAVLIPAAVAAYYARKFQRQNKKPTASSSGQAAEEIPSWMQDKPQQPWWKRWRT